MAKKSWKGNTHNEERNENTKGEARGNVKRNLRVILDLELFFYDYVVIFDKGELKLPGGRLVKAVGNNFEILWIQSGSEVGERAICVVACKRETRHNEACWRQ